MKGKYSINFKKFGAWIAVIAIIAAGAVYYINSGEETTSLSVEVEEELESGELTTVTATMDDSPVSGAQVYLNDENVGATNQEGRLTVPITQEGGEANIRVETADESTETTSTVVEQTSDGSDSSDDSNNSDDSDSSDSDDSDSSDGASGDQDSTDGTSDDSTDDSTDDTGDQDSTDGTSDDSNDSTGDSTDDSDSSNDGTSDNQDSTDDSADNPNDGSNDNTDTDTSNIEAYFSFFGEQQINQDLNFDASESQGENLDYSWDFGNGETATGESVAYTYSSSGTYTVTLTVTNQEGETDTTSTTFNIESAPRPNIVWDQPGDQTEIQQGEDITYEFSVGDATADAQYTIYAGQTEQASGQLNEGTNREITETITPPAGTFKTYIQVSQGEITEQTPERTITTQNPQNPEITLQNPTTDTTTIEDTTNIQFNYTTGQTHWADNLELQILDNNDNLVKSEERAASINDQYSIEKQLSAGETYNWQIEATNTEGQTYTTNQQTFEITKEQPDASITHNSPSDGATINDYQVTFGYTISSEVSATYTAEIKADEDMTRTWQQCDGNGSLQEETISYNEGETITTLQQSLAGGQTIDTTTEESFDISGSYRWNGETTSDSDNSVLTSSGPQTFTTTSQTPEDSSQECKGDQDNIN